MTAPLKNIIVILVVLAGFVFLAINKSGRQTGPSELRALVKNSSTYIGSFRYSCTNASKIKVFASCNLGYANLGNTSVLDRETLEIFIHQYTVTSSEMSFQNFVCGLDNTPVCRDSNSKIVIIPDCKTVARKTLCSL